MVSHPWFWQPDDASSAVPIFISASIGVAIYSLHGMSAEALLKFADRAMYRAKSTGCRVCLADREMASPREMPSLETSSQHTPEVVTAQALSAVISVHDRETALHEQRVAQLAEATARKLKRPEEEIHLVRLAALLHDIGKIGIPDAILHKADPLTEEEWIIVRRHPEIGRQILAQIGGVFGRLANSVGVHHERWDGRGYPNNRAGATIPLSARILAVVDSYDAMISPRPYRRELLTGVEAKTELQRGAGSQFDPHVVETFLCLLHEQENLHGPLEDRSAPGTSDQPHRTIDATTGKGQRHVETWRQQMEAWRQQIEAWQRQIEAWRQQQLVWQQRREALQQHQQHLAWRKQELERQLNQEYK